MDVAVVLKRLDFIELHKYVRIINWIYIRCVVQ